jgi:type IV secretory pathway TrbD component
LKNQTIATLAELGTPVAQVNEHGKFLGIVAFVIVLCALAGFGFIAWLVWFIHQKMHARDMNWSSEDSRINVA